MSNQKNLRAYLLNNDVIISASTKEEVEAVQKRLFFHGVLWAIHGNRVSLVEECLKDKMCVRFGVLYHAPGAAKTIEWKREFTAKEFLAFEPSEQEMCSPLEWKILSEIRAVATRLTAVEEGLAEVRRETAPVDLGKIKASGDRLLQP